VLDRLPYKALVHHDWSYLTPATQWTVELWFGQLQNQGTNLRYRLGSDNAVTRAVSMREVVAERVSIRRLEASDHHV